MDHSHTSRSHPDNIRNQGTVDHAFPILYITHPNEQTHSKEKEISMLVPIPSIRFINDPTKIHPKKSHPVLNK